MLETKRVKIVGVRPSNTVAAAIFPLTSSLVCDRMQFSVLLQFVFHKIVLVFSLAYKSEHSVARMLMKRLIWHNVFQI